MAEQGPDGDGGRDELSRLLTAVRGSRSQAEAARLSGLSQSRVSRAERGRFLLRHDDADRYARALGASAEQRARLAELVAARATRHVAGRVALVRVAAAIQERVGELESTSRTVRAWQPALVPGIAQTREYTAALLAGDGGGDPGPAWWSARLSRTARLEEGGRSWHLLLSEAALRWRLGSAEIMAAQVEHLVRLSRLPTVRLGIVPLDVPHPIVAPAAFHLYDDVVSVATEVKTSFVEDERDVAHFHGLFAVLDGLARHGDDARDLLTRLARPASIVSAAPAGGAGSAGS